MKLTMGKRELELPGKYLAELREANALLGDMTALWGRMEEDGYLLIRGLFDREDVLAARRQLVEVLDREGALDRSFPLMDAVVAHGQTGGFRDGDNDLTHSPAFRRLVESMPVMGFFERFLGGEPLTYDYKWLRIVGPGSNTGAHYDVVYMGRGTHNLFTCWTPLGDVPYELGPLAILAGSHRFDRVRETYGEMDADRDHVTGWFETDPIALVVKYGGRWLTTEFEMGDALIF